ncbi:MAG: acyl--CoA ligase [Ectothiorhodospiraceae bacterium]|nr:acyl--CoA ligase [Ectothiorhodospiraceae bacterium]
MTTTNPITGDPPLIQHRVLYGNRLVPCYADCPDNLDAVLRRSVAAGGERPAVVDGSRTLNYRELDREATRVATALEARGVGKGDRVALFLGNRLEFITTLFGVWRRGAIAVPIGTRQTRMELEYILNQCTASAILHEAALADRIPPPATVPNLHTRVSMAVEETPAGVDPEPETLDYRDFLGLGTDRDSAPAVDAEEPACIMYTSGTTGRPKGAMLSHLGFYHTARNYQRRFGYTAQDRMLLVVPATHISGLLACVMVMIQVAGCVVCLREFRAAEVLKTIESQRITASTMVPAMYNLCLLEPDFHRHDLSCWRTGHFGGAAVPEVTIERLAQKLPRLRLLNGFGATETTSAVTLTDPAQADAHLDSVGTALPCVDIRVLDAAGREVPPGEAGELWIRSPGNAIGYWNNPQASREAFVAGYWRSGDIGSVDEHGFVRVFDRIKDMINRGGYKVFCVELENVIQRFPHVIEVAAVGSPCPVLGERVHVFIHAKEPIDKEALRAFCGQELADYKVPDLITVSPDPLPRNPNGKLIKHPLREAARTMAAQSAPS